MIDFARLKTAADLGDFAARVSGGRLENVGEGIRRMVPCPFCQSKSGFTVYQKNNSFHCFACEKAGDLINFYAMLRDMKNIDAARALADELGVDVGQSEGGGGRTDPPPRAAEPAKPWTPQPENAEPDRREGPDLDPDRAAEVRAWAAGVYHGNLLNDEKALRYQMETRKHSKAVLERERVGVSWGNLLDRAKSDGVLLDELEAVGLARKRGRGLGETISTGMYVYPHVSKGQTRFFSLKDPTKEKKYQLKKKTADAGWLCWGQDALEESAAFILEGEDDRLSVLDAGYPCAAVMGNYNTAGMLAWLDHNAKGRVYWLAFDADAAGRGYATKYARAIMNGGGTAHILPMPEGMDIDDVLKAAANPKAALEELMRQAQECRLEEDAGPSGNISCGFDSFDVLGELSDGSLVFWSQIKRCIYSRMLKELTYEQLVQIGGEEVVKKVCRSKKDAENQDWLTPLAEVKSDLILQAGTNRISKLEKFGQGIHRMDDGRLLVVNGGEAFIYDGKGFEVQTYPLLNRRILIEFDPGYEWINSKALMDAVVGMTEERGRGIVQELTDLFRQWKLRGKYDHQIVAGWVLAQIVQSNWEWRPHLWMSGGKGTGKSLLNELIGALIGDLMLPCQGSKLTEPGLRQSIGAKACLVYIDEFEKAKNNSIRDSIIELLRISGRSGVGRIGSTHGQAQTFTLKHMVFVSAIERGISRAAEHDRFLGVETVKDVHRRPVIPPKLECDRMRVGLFAYALWAANRAREIVHDASTDFLGRSDESIAVPFSMLAACSTKWNRKTEALLNAMEDYRNEWDRHNQGTQEEDEVMLLSDILGSNINLPRTTVGGDERIVTGSVTIAQALFGPLALEHAGMWPEMVESFGVRRVHDNDAVFIYPAGVQRKLLRYTAWEGLQIKDILLRFEGAEWGKQYLAQSRPWGVLIPKDELEKVGLL